MCKIPYVEDLAREYGAEPVSLKIHQLNQAHCWKNRRVVSTWLPYQLEGEDLESALTQLITTAKKTPDCIWLIRTDRIKEVAAVLINSISDANKMGLGRNLMFLFSVTDRDGLNGGRPYAEMIKKQGWNVGLDLELVTTADIEDVWPFANWTVLGARNHAIDRVGFACLASQIRDACAADTIPFYLKNGPTGDGTSTPLPHLAGVQHRDVWAVRQG